MRPKTLTFVMVIITLGGPVTSIAAGPATQPAAQDVLAKALAAYANRPPVVFASETILDLPDKAVRQRFVAEFRQQGEKVDLVQTRSDVANNEEREVLETRAFWNGSRFVHAQQTPGRGHLTFLAYFSRQPRYRDIVVAYDLNCSYLDGFLGDMQHWAALLSESGEVTMQDAMSSIDGSPCYVLQGQAKHADYTVWVDPHGGYLMRKAIVRQGPEQPSPSATRPEFVLTSATLIVPSVTLRQIDGKWFPVAGACMEIRDYKHTVSGTAARDLVIRSAQRTDVQWNPDFERLHAFQIFLANGAAIKDNDQNRMFEWQADNIPPQMDGEVAEMLAKAAKATSSQPVRGGSGSR